MAENKIYSLKNFLLFGALITTIRIFYIYWLPYDLYPDEAQYWTWAKNPAFGYYSKPPFIAWIIWLSTKLCGDSQFCVKLPSPIIYFATSTAVYFIAKELISKRVAFLSAIAFITIPGVTVGSYLITTDAPLLLFWSLALYFFVMATKYNDIRWWLLAGLSAGFGLLSKYSLIVFLLSAVFYLFQKSPKKLRQKGFWVAVITAFLVLLPNIIWNYENAFVSYMHTKDNLKGEGSYFNISEFINFAVMQFGIFGPILFVTLLYILVFRIKLCFAKYPMLIYFIIPFLIIVCAVSFFSRAHGNWGAPLYIAATILVIAFLVEVKKEALITISILLHLLLASVFYNFEKTSENIAIKFRNPFDRVKGWQALALEADKVRKQYPSSILLSDERKNVSSIMYYLRDDAGKPGMVKKYRNNNRISDHYDLTSSLDGPSNERFIFVTKNADDIPKVLKRFGEKKKIKTIRIKKIRESEKYVFYLLGGFKGY